MPRPTRTPLMAGNWKIEPQPPGGGGPGPEAGLDARRQEARLRQGRGRRGAAVHRPALGADAGRRRPAQHPVRRPGRVRRTTAAPTPGEISAAMLAKLGLLLRRGRALRAPGVPRRDRRARQRQGAQGAGRRHDADRVRGRGARGPAGGRARRPTRWPRSTARWPGSPPSRSPGWSWPTSRSGRSGPARWPLRTTRRRCARRSGSGSGRCTATRPRTAYASSTAAR